jgi:hypothetical protein
MGLLDKLMFWKREEAVPSFEALSFPELQSPPGTAPQPFAPPEAGITSPPDLGPAPPPPTEFREQQFVRPGFTSAPQAMSPPAEANRDAQLVHAKLDTLKALLESVNAKLDRLERAQTKEELPVAEVRRWR